MVQYKKEKNVYILKNKINHYHQQVKNFIHHLPHLQYYLKHQILQIMNLNIMIQQHQTHHHKFNIMIFKLYFIKMVYQLQIQYNNKHYLLKHQMPLNQLLNKIISHQL